MLYFIKKSKFLMNFSWLGCFRGKFLKKGKIYITQDSIIERLWCLNNANSITLKELLCGLREVIKLNVWF